MDTSVATQHKIQFLLTLYHIAEAQTYGSLNLTAPATQPTYTILCEINLQWLITTYIQPQTSNSTTSVATSQSDTISYVNGTSLKGYRFKDRISIGGLVVPNQTFVAVSQGV